jgi:hypothetical protein
MRTALRNEDISTNKGISIKRANKKEMNNKKDNKLIFLLNLL